MVQQPHERISRAWWLLLGIWLWKLMKFVWVVIVLGILINVGSSWLITKWTSFDLRGTPLEWCWNHPWLTGLLALGLCSLTLYGYIAQLWQSHIDSSQPRPLGLLTAKIRLDLLHRFKKEHQNRLRNTLQGKTPIVLGLRERLDITPRLVRQPGDEHLVDYPAETTLIQAYEQAASGLLILGKPGAGKTTALLQLAVELAIYAERDERQPVPIVVNVSSWARERKPLEQWLQDYLFLSFRINRSVTAAGIDHDKLLFLFDGLNEMDAEARTACVQELDAYSTRHSTEQVLPLIACSRTNEFLQQKERLKGITAFEMQPLEQRQVMTYLRESGNTMEAIREAVQTNTTLAELIRTPLMLNVVMLTYQEKTIDDLPSKGSFQQQQRQVWAAYIKRMEERSQHRRRFSAKQIRVTLRWLALSMDTDFYVEQLQLSWLPVKSRRSSMWLQLVELLVEMLFAKHEEIVVVDAVRWSWTRFLVFLIKRGFGSGIIGLILLFVWGVRQGLVEGLRLGLIGGLVGLLTGGIGVGLIGGFTEVSVLNNERLAPNQGIRASGRNALVTGLVGGGLVGLAVELLAALHFGWVEWLPYALFLLLSTGLSLGWLFGGNAYIKHYALRFLLKHYGVIPWDIVSFLEEAVDCILLQRVGGGYQFIHPLLQEYFAALPKEY